MLSVTYLRRALHALVLIMWAPMPVWAAATLAQASAGLSDFGEIRWSILALAFGLSTLSGATALVWRLDQELRRSPDGKLPRPWLFAASNLMGSWTAGALAWITSQSQSAGVWPTLGLVILLSFGGARAIEAMAEKYLNKPESPL